MSTIDKIMLLLKQQNKKQKELTDFLGITKNSFTDWKSGRIKSYLKHIPAIAEFFNVSVDFLLDEESSDTNSFNLTAKEKRLITAYRNKPEMQGAVDKLLGVDDLTFVESGKIAAFGIGPKDATLSADALKDIDNLPDA